MTPDKNAKLAQLIIDHGRPIQVGWYDDGDVESGPRGGTWHGFRWGQLTLIEYSQGSIYIESRKCGDSPWGRGQGYPIVHHRVEDQAIRQQIQALKHKEEA